MSTGLLISLAVILVIEANAIFGKLNGAINSLVAVIHSSVVLSLIFLALIQFV
jgi:hypothetical protein